jgi:hypothetical protein
VGPRLALGWRISDGSESDLLKIFAPPLEEGRRLLVLESKQILMYTIAEGASRLHFI